MQKEKFLIVGHGGRESAFAKNLAQDTELYAVMAHKNPTIIEQVQASGGGYRIANPSDPQAVSAYAKECQIDYVFVSADGPLAAGVVDALLALNIKAVGGTQAATKIEWDKIYSIELVNQLCPEFTPFYTVIHTLEDIDQAIQTFAEKAMQVVVKPQGLTGGKGVKVMPEHLPTYADAAAYARELLQTKPNEKVLLVEKLEGVEFTIMGLTDGKHLVLAPASYDYPFRLENDLGPGTGGMGCFTNTETKLPFMTAQDLTDCRSIMQSVIDAMRKNDLLFNGVLNGGFFVTRQGIRFMEFNGRFGDPEGLNILSVLQSPLSELIKAMWHTTLSEKEVRFIKQASVVKYLVAKEYPEASPAALEFLVDQAGIQQMGLDVLFASAVQTENQRYATLQSSRVVALSAVSESIAEAAHQINVAIDRYITGDLEYRKDIGSTESLQKLDAVARSL